MVSRAIALFNEDEVDAIARFNDQNGGFLDRDLYLFALDPDDTVVAHTYRPDEVGIDARTVHDSTGLPIGQMILDSANAQGVWVDYTRQDPLTGEEHQKSS
jgi:cytochrome c